MKRSLQYGAFVVGLFISLFVGCASSPSFYRVMDLQSGKAYYTQEIDHLASGAVVVKDTRTDSIITLQSSQVKKISSDEYKSGLATPVCQPSSVAPAMTTAPASSPSITN